MNAIASSNEHYDEHDALFVLREFENPEKAVSFFRVANWICDSGFAKTFEPQKTGIAFAAGETFRRRIVTTVGERKIDAELDCFANDVGFGKFDQRRVNLEASAFDTGFGSDIGQVLERLR